ncbi:hypothetical protein SK128_012556 [Halocaridina rubra]|uniref:Uncharacterized protein n=1 Tax=Halocaridina rubra TaxID=373956 RepID=A0AAN8XAW2_HALRR
MYLNNAHGTLVFIFWHLHLALWLLVSIPWYHYYDPLALVSPLDPWNLVFIFKLELH